MASVQLVKCPMTSKLLKDLEKELSCKKCFKLVVSPKTFRNCQHFFCEACISHSINCPTCGVPSSAKDIYHDQFLGNLAMYVPKIEKSLRSLQGENTVEPGSPHFERNCSKTHTEGGYEAVGNKDSDFALEEGMSGSLPESEAELDIKIMRRSKRKLGKFRNSTLSPKTSTGSLKRISGDSSYPCPNPLDVTHQELSKKTTSSDIFKAPLDSDLDATIILAERNVPISESRENSNSLSKGDTFKRPVREVKKTQTLNSDLTTPVKILMRTACDSQNKNVSDSTKKAANKRNKNGETLLQVASKKGNLKQVQSLVADGANPNVKDNFGWTPLHEAIHYNNIEIAKELLENGGALVNTPGGDNYTPLHKAVALNVIEGIKLLLKYGAYPKLVDIYGNMPVDYSQSDEVTRTLERHSALPMDCSLMDSASKDSEIEEERIVFFGDGLSKSDLRLLGKLSVLIPGSRVSHSLIPDVTHMVVNAENGACVASVNVLTGILTGKDFVSVEWVQYSIEIRSIKHQNSPSVNSTKSYPSAKGLLKSRMCHRKLLPSIFSGMHFAISSVCRNLNYDNMKKDDIANLVALGNGHYHSREPDPEEIPIHEKTVPFYANNFVAELTGLDDHPLKNCSHVILYHQDDTKSFNGRNDQTFIKYNMAHFKSLPVAWFVGCIESFTLLDPTPFL